MSEMKVEHVLLFLVGAFLVYHMMGKCGRVEGFNECIKNRISVPSCEGVSKSDMGDEPALGCSSYYETEKGTIWDTYYPCEYKYSFDRCGRDGSSC